MNRDDFEAILEQLDSCVQQTTGKHLSEVQNIVLRGAWFDLTYDEMGADGAGYSSAYLRQDVGPTLWKMVSQAIGEKVGKKSVRLALMRWSRQQMGEGSAGNIGVAIAPTELSSPSDAPQADTLPPDPGWEGVLPPELWVGRDREVATVLRLITQEDCRLMVVSGAGGIGKTALAYQVAQQLREQFHIIWRSLSDAASAADLLHDLCTSLVGDIPLAQNGSGNRVATLVNQLSRRPCLIVLDGLEAAFEAGEAGRYRPQFEPLGELLRAVQRRSLRGCLLITSREIPQDISLLDRVGPRIVSLSGLEPAASQALLAQMGCAEALAPEPSNSDCASQPASPVRRLLDYCGGNPLVLQSAAIAIQTVFNRNLSQFLSDMQQGYVLPLVSQLVAEQLHRLSPAEQEVVYDLAIAQEPLGYETLLHDLASRMAKRSLPDTLVTLRRRSLVLQDSQTRYTLPPFVVDCVLEQFINQIVEELEEGRPEQFLKHALIRANAKHFIRDRQELRVLQPITEALLSRLGSDSRIDQQLRQVLSGLREAIATAGYGAGNLINLYRRLDLDLEGLNFCGLPIWQACLHDVNLAHVNMAQVEFSRCTFASCLGPQPLVALDPRGRYVAIGDRQGQIILWDTHANQQYRLWCDPDSSVTSLAFHPQELLLASGHSNQRVYLWNVRTTARFTVLLTDGGAVTSLEFSPDGAYLASGSGNGMLKHWQMQQSYLSFEYPKRHGDAVRSLCWSADGQRLASLSRSNDLMVWDVQTGDRLQVYPTSELSPVGSVYFGQDYEVLFLSSEEGVLKLTNLSRGHLVQMLEGHQDTVRQVVVGSAAGASQGLDQAAAQPLPTHAASVSSDQTLKVWNLRTGQACLTLTHLEGQISSLALAPEAQLLAGGSDRAICLWNLNTGDRYQTLNSHHCRVSALTVSQDGSLLALGNDDHTIKLWDTRTDSYLRTLRGHSDWISAIALSPDRRCCASGTYEGSINLWDIQSGRCLRSLPMHRQRVRSLAFSPDGSMLASASDDGNLKIWRVESGTCLHSISAHDDRVNALQFSPDGKILATASADHTLACWQVSTGEKEALLPMEHHDRVLAIAVSATGDRLLSCSDDQTARLWNRHTGECEAVWNGGLRKVYTVSFNGGDRPLVCGSDGSTLGIWDVMTGQVLASITDEAGLQFTAFSSAQGLLLGLVPQNKIMIWPYGEVSQPRRLEVNQPYQNMNITGATGITEAQRDLLRSLGAIER